MQRNCHSRRKNTKPTFFHILVFIPWGWKCLRLRGSFPIQSLSSWASGIFPPLQRVAADRAPQQNPWRSAVEMWEIRGSTG